MIIGTPQVPWLPADNLLLDAAADPFTATAANALIAGSQYIFRITARTSPLLISNLWFLPSAAGSGASTGTFAGLFSTAGALLTGSADAGAALSSTSPAQVPLTTPQLVPAGGSVYGALLANLVSMPSVRCGVGATGGPVNAGLTAAAARYAVAGTLLTALTAFTPSGVNPATFAPWWGAS